MRLYQPSANGGESVIWDDTAEGGPMVGTSGADGLDGHGIVAVDPFGRVSNDLDVVKDAVPAGDEAASPHVAEIDDRNRGWHVILRVPVPAVEGRHPARQIVLGGRVDYRRLEQADDVVYTVRRKLFIDVDQEPFPSFDGWRYYDSHTHTAAEFDPDLSVAAIRKSFGGPAQMVKEAAYAVGMIDAPEQARDRVVITDHNCFFSDSEVIRCGPSAKGVFHMIWV